MKKSFVTLALCLLCAAPSPAPAQQPAAAPKPKVDFSTPEASIREFLDALNSYDAKRVEDCVFQANRRNRAPLLARMEQWKKSNYKIAVKDIHVEMQYVRGAFAIVEYLAEFTKQPDDKRVSYKGTDLVKLTNFGPPGAQQWQLLSIPPEHMWSGAQGGDIQMAITPIAYPEVYEPPAMCCSNIRQVGGAVHYSIAKEFDGKFAVLQKALASPAGPDEKAPWSPLKRALATYDDPKNNYFPTKSLRCPADAADANTESYAFNDKLEGVELSKITEPANTVLVYEGKDGKLNFRHGCQAAVYFADGHDELISEEQAKTLRWTP